MTKAINTAPPRDLAYEKALLGYLMLPAEPPVFSRLESIARPEFFWHESTRHAFEAAMSVGRAGGAITEHTIASMMKSRGLGDYIDGPDFFSGCRELASGNPEDAMWFTLELRKLYVRRQLINAANSIVIISNRGELEEQEMFGSALEAVMSINQGNMVDKGVRSMGEVIESGVREQVDSITGLASSTVRYIPTGIQALDFFIRGLRMGGLYLISAPTSLGKSLAVQGLSIDLAKRRHSSLNFVTEMSDEDVVTRQVFMIAGMDEHDVRAHGTTSDGIALSEAMNIATELPIYYQDSPDLTIEKLEVTIHQEMRRSKPEVIIVDHFHELRTERKFTRADEPLEYIAGRLKIIARTYDVPIVCVVQQNRGNHEGNLNAALKGTSALEQKADVVVFFQAVSDDGQTFLTPDEARQRAGEQKWMRVKARITKVRTGGMTGSADLVLDWQKGGQFMNWEDWEPVNRERIQRSNLLSIRQMATI